MSFVLKEMKDDDFFKYREEVLKEWKLDKYIDIDEVLNFYKTLPQNKIFTKKLEDNNEKKVCIQASTRGILTEEETNFLDLLQSRANIDILSVEIDSYTKEKKYEICEREIIESKKINRSTLNGFPIINYGIENTRRMIREIEVPLQLKHSNSTDSRFLVEVAIASGISSIEGGAISYNIPFSKSVSLEETLKNWQYIDKLIGIYQRKGLNIHREPYSILTATLVPPAISNVIQILECLLAVEQGVKNISLASSQYGNLVQDIASLEVLKEEAIKYCKNYGYNDINISTLFHQWVGGFPKDSVKSYGTLAYGSFVGILSGADRIFVRNPEDFNSACSNISYIDALNLTDFLLKMMSNQKNDKILEIEHEKNIIRKEMRLILGKIQELAQGDLKKGIIESFKRGILDIPFAPSKFNLGKMMPARDKEGMIRYLDIGNLPFDKEIIDFHKKKLGERALSENKEITFQMTVDDIFAMSNGELFSFRNDI